MVLNVQILIDRIAIVNKKNHDSWQLNQASGPSTNISKLTQKDPLLCATVLYPLLQNLSALQTWEPVFEYSRTAETNYEGSPWKCAHKHMSALLHQLFANLKELLDCNLQQHELPCPSADFGKFWAWSRSERIMSFPCQISLSSLNFTCNEPLITYRKRSRRAGFVPTRRKATPRLGVCNQWKLHFCKYSFS